MNTIIFHLESFNMLLLRQFKELYKELYNLPINRYWFENFYSTSTSTIMSIADVLYGDVSKFDKTVSFDNLIDGDWSIKSICKSNRKSRALFYPNFWNARDLLSLKSFFNNFNVYEEYTDFREDIINSVKTNNYGVLFIYDGSSSLAMLNDSSLEHLSWFEQWYQGKVNSIKTIRLLIDSLIQNKLLNQVQIVIYGDHGNDFFSHSLKGGYTHCIEPYNNLIHVPLIYYHPGIKKRDIYEIFSMEYLRHLIDLGRKNIITETDYKSFLCNCKPYAFSRNMFAAQRDDNLPYSKAYSISEINYNLIVSKKGLEMYISALDPTNQWNVLDCFEIHSNVLRPLKKRRLASQFLNVINENHCKEIVDKYIFLKDVLFERVRRLNENTQINLFEELCFDKINYIFD